MVLLRLLVICCCLLLLLPTRAVAAPPQQSAQCDIAAMLPMRVFDLPYVEETQITIGDAPLSLRICAPATESATAHHLLNVLLDALPKLSAASGLPLQGDLDRRIVILPDGAFPANVDGAFSRPTGLILLQRESAETTIVHEGAHYWANDRNFAEAWMAEGYADYLAEQVTGKVRMLAPGDTRCADVALREWDYNPPTTTICAYIVGAAVFRDLAQAVGAPQLRATLHELSDGSSRVDSWNLLIGLERASGQDLTPIMRHRVFGPREDALLDRRSQTRGQLQAAQRSAAGLGVVVPAEIAAAIDANDFAAADRWLSRLMPFLGAASALAQQCKALELSCAGLWPTEFATPEAIVPVERLLDVRKLLDRYASLSDQARALGRTPPRGLADAVLALRPDAATLLDHAQATLKRGHALDQSCQRLDAPCITGWLDSWSGGDLALADADINTLTPLLDQAAHVEQRCGAALTAACRAVWHPYLQGRQFVETRVALAKLNDLLEQAPAVERRCGDLANLCRQDWQNALQSGQLWGLKQRLSDLDRMLARGEEVETACARASWPCAQMWRAKFSQSENGDPQPALAFLNDIQGALPVLSQTSAIAGSPASGINSWLQIASGPDAPTLLAGARRAFEAGDVADARTLAEQALAAAKAPRTNWPPAAFMGSLLALVLAGMLALAGALVWLRSRNPRVRLASDNKQLLEALLAQPPGTAAGPPSEKIRKAA